MGGGQAIFADSPCKRVGSPKFSSLLFSLHDASAPKIILKLLFCLGEVATKHHNDQIFLPEGYFA